MKDDDGCVCVCAGEALLSEGSIHVVPFQFDLIQLLPKCQQVELFFLTFSTGNISSPGVILNMAMSYGIAGNKSLHINTQMFVSGGARRAGPRHPLSAQRAAAQPLPQQPGARAQRQRGPAR